MDEAGKKGTGLGAAKMKVLEHRAADDGQLYTIKAVPPNLDLGGVHFVKEGVAIDCHWFSPASVGG